MKILKTLGLTISALIFCFSLSVISANAQPGSARYEGNNGKHKGWDKGKHKGWYKNKGWDRDSYSRRRYSSRNRISTAERRRLSHSRTRLNRSVYRANRDGVVTNAERRRIVRRTATYNRRYRRTVRN